MTVLASQPSVSIETLTTQRTSAPSLPFLPTVFITSRSRSSIGELVGVGARVALAVLSLELGDLQPGGLLEVVLERLAGLELRGVNQDAEGSRHRLPVDDVAEERRGCRACAQ